MIGWNRKRNDRDNPDERDGAGGELVPFPQRQGERGPARHREVPRRGRSRPGLGTVRVVSWSGPRTVPLAGPTDGEDHEVLEGTIVPVDPPVRRGSDWLTELHARREQRHPVIPAWLRSWEQAVATGKWVVGYAAHVVAFHAVRTPLYGLKLALRAPVGAFRLVGSVMRWWWDLDGEQVRLATVTPKPDPETYLRLARHRDARVRGRTILLVIGLVAAAVAGVWAWLAAPVWSRWPALAVFIAVLGLAGAPADRPLIGPGGGPHPGAAADRRGGDPRARRRSASPRSTRRWPRAGTGSPSPRRSPATAPAGGPRSTCRYGVTVTDIMERRDRLASGLRRPLGCVWPEPAHDAHAGRLVLWVGDQDMSKAKAAGLAAGQAPGRRTCSSRSRSAHDQRGRPVSFR